MRGTAVVLLLLLSSNTQLLADEGTDFLRKFHKNPRQWMNKKPAKYRQDGTKIDNVRRWPKHTRAFQMRNDAIKDAIDKQILGEGKQGWQAHDNPRHLFEDGVKVETDIMQLPAAGELTFKPWSADYWPLAKGGISYRYADPDFKTMVIEDDTYARVIDYYQQPTDFLRLPPIGAARQQKLDMYSPAEKYDLLVGSSDFTLTNEAKQQGYKYADEDGAVAAWMGICHGWAIAAYASPRPAQSIAVKAVDGKTTVNFYPDDLRALVSLKWASASSWRGLFIGGRCNVSQHADDDEQRVNIDAETGRVLDAECFDTNPGTWHTVVTNKIGRYNESFIMDATFDAEVWNQPVYAYKVQYYHPRTKAPGTLAASIMPIDAQWKREDTFAAFRNNPQAKKIVVVKMSVTYVVENAPQPGKPAADDLTNVTYWYDLELDEHNNIIGGEWLSNYHPDFLWTKRRTSRPQNTVDHTISRLVVDAKKTVRDFVAAQDVRVFNKALLGRLSELADLSVRMDNTPLELITYGLVELSR